MHGVEFEFRIDVRASGRCAIIQPMRRILTILAAGLAGPCLYAQLSAQPETWAVLQGADAVACMIPANVLFLALEARAKITASNLANNPKVEARRLGEYAFEVLAKNDTMAVPADGPAAGSGCTTRLPGEWLEVASSLRFQTGPHDMPGRRDGACHHCAAV